MQNGDVLFFNGARWYMAVIPTPKLIASGAHLIGPYLEGAPSGSRSFKPRVCAWTDNRLIWETCEGGGPCSVWVDSD
ncbi:hypothetical protein [Mesorhizobium sp. M5C.F.Ca.IN.020.29.1.1]|uniref:hypothetical protein n=1 Tax=Mesorhizobium sp. M5C.F.Ca.IN.020.29.1.1 TaxID=2496770 RepID=UPI000FC9E22C|nr:hypothetical protein [Mesorhizobium sp. M5C.F.Ca.IN.020.29.1.1]